MAVSAHEDDDVVWTRPAGGRRMDLPAGLPVEIAPAISQGKGRCARR
jgi:hypothetical protein